MEDDLISFDIVTPIYIQNNRISQYEDIEQIVAEDAPHIAAFIRESGIRLHSGDVYEMYASRKSAYNGHVDMFKILLRFIRVSEIGHETARAFLLLNSATAMCNVPLRASAST